jgi:hypothetical protein
LAALACRALAGEGGPVGFGEGAAPEGAEGAGGGVGEGEGQAARGLGVAFEEGARCGRGTM